MGVLKNKPKQKKNTSNPRLAEVPVRKNLPTVLQLNEMLFTKYILPYVKPLEKNATKEQKKETALKLLEIIHTNGGLAGIKYEEGINRTIKSPNEVLKDKKADCDELAFLYISVAERLKLGIEDFSILEMKFNFSEGNSNHAVVLNIENKVFELTTGRISRINGTTNAELNKAYAGKPFNEKEVVSVSLISNSKGGKEMGATYYETRANDMLREGKIVEAVESFEEAYNLKPTKKRKGKIIRNSFSISINLREQNKYKSAEKYLKKILKYEKTNAMAHYNLGVCYSKRTGIKYKRMAIREFQKAINNASDKKLMKTTYHVMKTIYHDLLVLQIEIKDLDGAEETIKGIEQKNIISARLYRLMGDVHRIRGRHKEAIEVYDNSIALDKGYLIAYYNKAVIFYNLGAAEFNVGEYKKATKNFGHALDVINRGLNNCSSDVNHSMLLNFKKKIKKKLK